MWRTYSLYTTVNVSGIFSIYYNECDRYILYILQWMQHLYTPVNVTDIFSIYYNECDGYIIYILQLMWRTYFRFTRLNVTGISPTYSLECDWNTFYLITWIHMYVLSLLCWITRQTSSLFTQENVTGIFSLNSVECDRHAVFTDIECDERVFNTCWVKNIKCYYFCKYWTLNKT